MPTVPRVRYIHRRGKPPVAGLTASRAYEVLESSEYYVQIRDDTGAEVWRLQAYFVPDFELWLEFEHWVAKPGDDPNCDFFNMQIRLADGRFYAANVWTFDFFPVARREQVEHGEALSGLYMLPPDLFVARLDRGDMVRIVEDLLNSHGWELPAAWRAEPPPDEEELADGPG
jgi:hypothetical protein